MTIEELTDIVRQLTQTTNSMFLEMMGLIDKLKAGQDARFVSLVENSADVTLLRSRVAELEERVERLEAGR